MHSYGCFLAKKAGFWQKMSYIVSRDHGRVQPTVMVSRFPSGPNESHVTMWAVIGTPELDHEYIFQGGGVSIKTSNVR